MKLGGGGGGGARKKKLDRQLFSLETNSNHIFFPMTGE